MGNAKLKLIFLIGLAYILSTAGSYLVFSQRAISQGDNAVPVSLPGKDAKGNISFDQSLPRTETCPLNGVLYSKQQRVWWEQHRPLGVMIENHEEARPQSGLSSADVIYEAVAEGGITRFLTVFYCQAAPYVGPVRSARTYFLDFISEYGNYPLYSHVGGANCDQQTGSGCGNGAKADALGQIERYGWSGYNDLSEFSIGCPVYCRDYSRGGRADIATEHTMYSSTSKLWDVAKSRGLTNVDKDGVSWDTTFTPYSFKEDTSLNQRGNTQSIHMEFWPGYSAYAVDWIYDKTNNLYKRNTGGVAHMDRNTGKQLMAKNIVVLHMVETNSNDNYTAGAHQLIGDIGDGKATFFIDGNETAGTWRKDSRIGRTLLFDSMGRPIKFDKGIIWFEILPTDGVLTEK